MRFSLASLRERATGRPDGYLEDVLAHGIIDGDHVELTAEAFAFLRNKYNPPSLLEQAGSIAIAAGKWMAARFPVVDEQTFYLRSCHCAVCLCWDARAGRCLACGCYQVKHHLATEKCPLGKWEAVSDP